MQVGPTAYSNNHERGVLECFKVYFLSSLSLGSAPCTQRKWEFLTNQIAFICRISLLAEICVGMRQCATVSEATTVFCMCTHPYTLLVVNQGICMWFGCAEVAFYLWWFAPVQRYIHYMTAVSIRYCLLGLHSQYAHTTEFDIHITTW